MVEGYRVYLHEADPVTDEIRLNNIHGFGTHRIDTKDLSIRIGELKQNVVYELVVKAGNQYGEWFWSGLRLKAKCLTARWFYRLECANRSAEIHNGRPQNYNGFEFE